MKIRTGFVSNSSSASFIVALNKSEECPNCKRVDMNFIDVIDAMSRDYSGDDTELHARNVSQIMEWLSDYIDQNKLQTEPWVSIIRRIRKAVEDGKEVAAFDISYHDKVSNWLFEQQCQCGTVEKIWSDHE